MDLTQLNNILSTIPWPVIVTLSLFELIVKGIALWRTAQKKKMYWFIGILIINSLGIVPLIYLAFFDKKPSKNKS